MKFRPRIIRAAPSHTSEALSPSWRTSLYATCFAQMTAMLAFGFVLPFLALYLKELGVQSDRAIELWSGALVASTAVSLAIFSPVWGALADRRGRKLMVLRAMIAGGFVLAAMGFVQNVFELLGLRILQGAVTGTVAASTALVSTIVPKDRLAYSMGLLQTSIYLGISGGPVVGGVIAEAVGIRGTFIVAGILLASAGLAIWLFVHEHYLPLTTQRRPGFLQSMRAGLQSQTLMPLLVVVMLIQLSSAIVFPILPLFVANISGPQDPVKLYSGLAFGATAVFSALAAVSYSRVVERSGYRRLLVFAAFAAAAFFLPQAFVRTPGQLLLLRAGLGLFFGVLIPATNAMVGLGTPGNLRGSAYGLTSSATAMGNAIGPLIGSVLAATLGLRAIFIATAGVLALLGVWIIGLVREPVTPA
ncbi:MAG TPA: MFS transporter [Candidatus Limnocylindrales bacterium]|nr:MFS transporter [Candidatus Limnocylindrales bacterium]